MLDIYTHKKELPAGPNLLPPPVNSVEEHFDQIKKQLFALCYNTETFIDRSDLKTLLSISPIAWSFIHEVLLQLPRTFADQDIVEARLQILESLYQTERAKPIRATELVNPGALDPTPALCREEEDSDISHPVPVESLHDGNPATEEPLFSLTQNALALTDGVEYIVEFIPDDEQEATGSQHQLVPTTSPKPRSGHSKGKGKKKAASQTSGVSALKAHATAKTAANTPARRKRASKASRAISPPSPTLDCSRERKQAALPPPTAQPEPRECSSTQSPKPRLVASDNDSDDAPANMEDPPSSPSPTPALARPKRGRPADDVADHSPSRKRVHLTPKTTVVPPVASGSGPRRSSRNKK
ncbi:hypothetical protein B0H15DRAFT_844650 [Mycena belliarum]|uniref:Uncharacterized protein n=1 Tax=Mycena belliarum TaxID=1033014 RepID=A0AAD6XLB8_9AGAR|nr:hypothetical protein B0H15DRAFT_844650 [Mycena belliae]